MILDMLQGSVTGVGHPHTIAYHSNAISEGNEIEIDTSTNTITNITKNQTYKMKPFSEIIGKIIAAGGIFKYNPDEE